MKNEPPYEAEESLLADLQWLRHLAARLIQDPGLAEDACQEAWLLAGGTGELAGRRPALFRAMRRFAWRSNRSETRRKAREQQHAKPVALPSTAELIARGEERQVLWRRLTELEEPYRTALLLKFQEGLATREIAARQGALEDTVRRWIRRGLELLRERYDADREGGGLESLALAALPLGLSSTSAPLAGAASTAQVATGGAGTSMSAAASSAAAILGAWIMKKSLIGVVLVVAALVLGNTLLREPADRGAALKAGAARANAELVSPEAAVVENLIPAPIEEERTAVVASAPVEPEPEAEPAAESCRVYGRIVDAKGEPLFGARARLSSGETHWSSVPEWEREATTDIDGRFSVQSEGYQGKRPIRLFATATPFHAEVELQFGKTDECDFAALRLPSVDVGTIRLAPAGVVQARLVNELGEPIEGAWITTSPGRGYTRSAHDGRFRMEHRSLGGQRISIDRADYLGQDRTITIPLGEALDLGEVVLETAPRVSGRVTDANGRAVPGASVSTGGYTRGWVFDVEADGTFDVPLRKTSSAEIYSRADGYQQTDGQRVSPGESDLHIILTPHRPFYTIDVVDEVTGEKLTDFGIKLRKGSVAEGGTLPKDQWEWKAPKVEDHWYGRARMLAKAGYELVDIVAPGFERKVVGLTIEPIHDQIQVVGLVPKGGIVGRLIGEEGPLANVSMSLHFGMVGRVENHESDENVPLDEDQPLAQHLANQGMFSILSMVPLDEPLPGLVHSTFGAHKVYKAYTDDAGRFRFLGVADGVGRLQAELEPGLTLPGDLFPVGAEGELDLGDIRTVKAAKISGRLVPETPCDLTGTVVTLESDGDRVFRVEADGSFEFAGVFPGDHWLGIKPGPEVCSPKLWVQNFYLKLAPGEEREQEVTIPALPGCALSATLQINGERHENNSIDFYLAGTDDQVGDIYFAADDAQRNGQVQPGRSLLPAGVALKARAYLNGTTLEYPTPLVLPIGKEELTFEFATCRLDVALPQDLELPASGEVWLAWTGSEGQSGPRVRRWLEDERSFVGENRDERRLLFPHVPAEALAFELLLQEGGPYAEEEPVSIGHFEAELKPGETVRVSM